MFENITYFVFDIFNESLFARNQAVKLSCSLFIVSCKCRILGMNTIEWYHLHSSTFKNMSVYMLVYMINKRGSSADPCGMPHSIVFILECMSP